MNYCVSDRVPFFRMSEPSIHTFFSIFRPSFSAIVIAVLRELA